MTIPNVVLDQFITVPWGNAVADSINRGIRGGQAIVEMATTPGGIVVNEMQWSTTHQAMMRWTGTQWVFAGGPPSYFVSDDMWGFNGNVTFNAMGVAASSQQTDSPPHFGVQRVFSGSATNTGIVYKGANSSNFLSSGAGLRMRAVFLLPSVVAGTIQRIGFHDWAAAVTPPVDGAWLDVVTGVATFNTASASTLTSNVTTATLVINTWYTIHVWFPTTSTARCIVVQDNGTVVLDVTNVANIPTGTNKFGAGAGAIMTTNVANTTPLDLDWLGWGYSGV